MSTWKEKHDETEIRLNPSCRNEMQRTRFLSFGCVADGFSFTQIIKHDHGCLKLSSPNDPASRFRTREWRRWTRTLSLLETELWKLHFRKAVDTTRKPGNTRSPLGNEFTPASPPNDCTWFGRPPLGRWSCGLQLSQCRRRQKPGMRLDGVACVVSRELCVWSLGVCSVFFGCFFF